MQTWTFLSQIYYQYPGFCVSRSLFCISVNGIGHNQPFAESNSLVATVTFSNCQVEGLEGSESFVRLYPYT